MALKALRNKALRLGRQKTTFYVVKVKPPPTFGWTGSRSHAIPRHVTSRFDVALCFLNLPNACGPCGFDLYFRGHRKPKRASTACLAGDIDTRFKFCPQGHNALPGAVYRAIRAFFPELSARQVALFDVMTTA